MEGSDFRAPATNARDVRDVAGKETDWTQGEVVLVDGHGCSAQRRLAARHFHFRIELTRDHERLLARSESLSCLSSFLTAVLSDTIRLWVLAVLWLLN